MIINDDGYIAIRYYQTIPHVLSVGNNFQYVFSVKARVCMAWVRPDHVSSVLAVTKVCCGNNKKTVYRYANDQEVNIWTAGGGTGR